MRHIYVHVHVHVHSHVHACHVQVNTSAKLCFPSYDLGLNSNGLVQRMKDFWENSTVGKA